MAVFKALSGDSAKQIASSENQFISTTIYAADQIQTPAFDVISSDSTFSGGQDTFNHKSFTETRWNALSATSFGADLFYNALHYTYQGDIIDGESLEVGVITQEISYELNLFNYYFSTEQIESVSITANQGISIISPSAGQIMKPLEEITLEILIEEEGSAVIDAILTVKLVGRSELYSFYISGLRFVLFPFTPQTPYTENNEWLTNIQTSLTGKEIRTGLRKSPRRGVNFNIKISDITEKNLFDNLMTAKQSKVFAVPSWGELTILDYNIQATDTEIYIDTANLSYRAGTPIIIFSEYDNNAVVTITGVEPDKLILSVEVGFNFSKGALVMPVYSGYTSKSINMNEFTSEAIDLNIGFEFLEEQDLSTFTPVLEFEGKPLFLDDYIFQNKSRSVKLNAPYSRIDFQTGLFRMFDLREFNTRSYNYGVVLNSRSEIWAFREFLHWCRGAQNTFFISTMSRANLLYDNIGIGEAFIDVIKNGSEKFIKDSKTRKRLIISYPGGYYIATITDIIDFNDYERIVLDTISPTNILKGEVNISFLVNVRIGKENVELEWLNPNEAEVKLNLLEVDN